MSTHAHGHAQCTGQCQPFLHVRPAAAACETCSAGAHMNDGFSSSNRTSSRKPVHRDGWASLMAISRCISSSYPSLLCPNTRELEVTTSTITCSLLTTLSAWESHLCTYVPRLTEVLSSSFMMSQMDRGVRVSRLCSR